MSKKLNKIKLVIYTSLFGLKEKLGDPLINLENDDTDLDISFVCFTDSILHKSNIWEIKIIEDHFLPSDKFSRRVKTMPHKYFPDIKYSLFIDNTVSLKRLPKLIDLVTENSYLYKSFMHSGRNNLFEELLAVNGLGYENSDYLLNLKEHYSKFFNLSNVSPLTTNTVILREHNHPQIIKLGEIWWEHILNFSKRDQLSFDFIKKITNTDIEYFSGTKMDNDLVFPQSNFSASRILSNFDEKKYSYMNNIKQSEYYSAKNNYFTSSPDLNRSNLYARRNSNFSMIANLCFSGMTDRFSPRRNLDHFLSSKLNSFQGKKPNILILFNNNSSETSFFSNEELINFKKALSIYVIDSSIDQIIISDNDLDSVKNLNNKKYDLLIFFNFCSIITDIKFYNILRLFLDSLPKILFLLDSNIDNKEIQKIYNFLSNFNYLNFNTSGYFHDVLDKYLDNSVLYIS